MMENFIKHVLGVGTDHPGLYGKTSAYYGTVEQQGRLMLHMHLLLWIEGSLTPQEIRERIMDPESDFQRQMVEYLESVHVGEFLTGKMEDVKKNLDLEELDDKYNNPTETLPVPPPPPCDNINCTDCDSCEALSSWDNQFKSTVDDILLRSNIHKCTGGAKQYRKKLSKHDAKRTTDKYQPVTGCLSNKWGKCKACFPRKTFEQTEVDMDTGALNIKKGEAMINTITAEVTYLIRSNTDVTSLLSGTAIKAVVAYVSDYISKPSLKTYMIFEAVKSVFDKNSEMLEGSMDRKEKARRLLTQIVNALTSKLEIGGHMASMYLLGNPDHYTGNKFRTFYWKSFINEARYAWHHESAKNADDQMVLLKIDGEIVGRTLVQDYIYRPSEFSHISLYDWIRLSDVQKCNSTHYIASDDFQGDSDDSSDHGDEEKTYYHFQKDYPLYKLHYAALIPPTEEWIPNFVGGAIP